MLRNSVRKGTRPAPPAVSLRWDDVLRRRRTVPTRSGKDGRQQTTTAALSEDLEIEPSQIAPVRTFGTVHACQAGISGTAAAVTSWLPTWEETDTADCGRARRRSAESMK